MECEARALPTVFKEAFVKNQKSGSDHKHGAYDAGNAGAAYGDTSHIG